jgi:hypothetical protein
MSAGFVYVLVNSSMPGVIKVGKTTRTPSERVGELSGVTGVPTPFIVAYEEHFADCDAAEQFLHTKLTEKGLRVSESREFFRAPVSEVVKLIASIPSNLGSRSSTSHDGIEENMGREICAPWEAILSRANDFREGKGECIQDYAEAMKLYRHAARLGSALATEELGEMYALGIGTRKDTTEAIELFKEGAEKGNFFCWDKMARVFIGLGNLENARKAIVKFLASGEEDGWRSYRSNPNKRPHIGEMMTTLVISQMGKPESDIQEQFLRLFDHYRNELILMGKQQASNKVIGDSFKANVMGVVKSLEALGNL